MPTYSYGCNKCGTMFDIFRSMGSDDESVECPICGTTETERVYSGFNFLGGSNCAPSYGGG
ncbi:MAG: zinc ribbon domain-containing protein [Dehalococcoidaceae bacterium]|nr:zinc ribbon domain-containing protein [Dehalococcoidaceae bacterium]